MIRRYGESKIRGVFYRTRPGAYVILPLGEEILLTHQGPPYNELQLPGGGIDAGESPIRALHREVLEETGWRISNPKLFRTFRRFAYMPDYDMWAEKICKIYVARPTRKLSAPLEAQHTASWVNLKSSPTVLKNNGDRASLELFLARKFH